MDTQRAFPGQVLPYIFTNTMQLVRAGLVQCFLSAQNVSDVCGGSRGRGQNSNPRDANSDSQGDDMGGAPLTPLPSSSFPCVRLRAIFSRLQPLPLDPSDRWREACSSLNIFKR